MRVSIVEERAGAALRTAEKCSSVATVDQDKASATVKATTSTLFLFPQSVSVFLLADFM